MAQMSPRDFAALRTLKIAQLPPISSTILPPSQLSQLFVVPTRIKPPFISIRLNKHPNNDPQRNYDADFCRSGSLRSVDVCER